MIWVDMDGVAADFDLHYFNLFGVRTTRWPDADNVDWKLVQSVPDFYLTMPKMHDFDELVAGLGERPWNFLTGCPRHIDVTDNHKIDWSARETSPERGIVCCQSRDKCKHGQPGDILIDDYLKYRSKWVDMGGIFIHHTSAASTIEKLEKLEQAYRLVDDMRAKGYWNR